MFTCFSKKSLSVFSKEQVEVLRGGMSIAIVAFHLSCYTKSWLSLFSNWGAPIVSIFYFISGYGLMYSKMHKGYKYMSNFLERRILCSLLVPFAIVWLINSVLVGNWQVNNLYTEFVDLFKLGKTSLPFSWYVFSILFFYLMFFLTAKSKHIIVVSFIYTILYIALTYYLGYERRWYISALAFPLGLFYCKIEKQVHVLWNDNFKYYVTVPICVLFLTFIVISKNEMMFLLAYICIQIIVVCLFAKLNVNNTCLAFIGSYSYEIYLCHGVCMMFLRSNNVYIRSDIRYIISTYILTFFMAFLVKSVCILLTTRMLKINNRK